MNHDEPLKSVDENRSLLRESTPGSTTRVREDREPRGFARGSGLRKTRPSSQYCAGVPKDGEVNVSRNSWRELRARSAAALDPAEAKDGRFYSRTEAEQLVAEHVCTPWLRDALKLLADSSAW